MKLPADFDQPFIKIIEQAMQKHRERTFLVFKGDAYTYGDVDKLSAQIANKLVSIGFEPGMKGAVYSQNSAISFIAVIGILRAGGVWIPVNPRNSAETNIELITRLNCNIYFYQDAFSDAIEAVAGKTDPYLGAISLEEVSNTHPTLFDWIEGQSTESPGIYVSGDDLVAIPTTGGTTGVPKGVKIGRASCRERV